MFFALFIATGLLVGFVCVLFTRILLVLAAAMLYKLLDTRKNSLDNDGEEGQYQSLHSSRELLLIRERKDAFHFSDHTTLLRSTGILGAAFRFVGLLHSCTPL